MRSRRVRAAALGLLFIIETVACARRPDPRVLATGYDRVDGTGLYTWLVDHEPSSIVAWHVPVDRLNRIVPNARLAIASETEPCADAARDRAALVTIVAGEGAAGRRSRALDCGIALFADAHGLVIAPR